jgi:cyclopropane-fatty-acyl-phospholipid synthase
VLGRHRKYSSCLWREGVADLDQAEADALTVSCERAGLEDGMRVLDLGCGWGSLSLWVAEHYPGCQVTSVSNSAPQREYIEAQARQRGLDNIRVLTRDMNAFDAGETGQKFHRVLSVEMFEHMRNWGELFRRIRGWLEPDGRFFMHVFCHRDAAYAFEDRGPGDWMSRHFFSGGIMPSADLPLRFQRDLRLERQWKWNGRHYEKTANAWLERLDRQAPEVRALFEGVYGADQAQKWVQRWRIFFMACAELFGQDRGQEWYVSHYLLAPREPAGNGA